MMHTREEFEICGDLTLWIECFTGKCACGI
jgi:hypothetical protein